MAERIDERIDGRTVLRISGQDRVSFLQNLVTNDVRGTDRGLVYAALLTPQGKFLADFFLAPDGDGILLDVASDLAPGLARRLAMYRLRADVAIETTELHVSRGLGPRPAGAFDDPRHPTLGWRQYGHAEGTGPVTDWDAIRVAHCIPETGIELLPDESYILECGFERLHGVDFRKGCYVGQEVTARMKHKTDLRKGLLTVQVTGDAAPGTEITADGKPAGRLFTRAGERAIAYLRFDRAEGPLIAGGARIQLP
ncbi:CAF17-like 4Fe-4S cluster assembly/insertion protein YgfZ [Albidovulum sediminis]|uniref:Folate-binding protein n=1 Tax=Albidovulum sediminis TaxID=3066345 RepID=A0ABT2NNT0_9RHOB|nr:folate-binding protein [Defluviimonas sediminis]MCT8330376.1 folate-binding protein [Defluviimonas sediminis]